MELTKTWCRRPFRFYHLAVSIPAILAAIFISTAQAADTSSYQILSAREKGVSSTGLAKGTVVPTFDQTVNKDVLDFGYTLPKDSSVQVWIKSFPQDISKASVNTARIGVRVLDTEQVKQISMKVEIKGTTDTQIIPLTLKSGWNSAQETIDWEKIGDLSEITFIVTPIGDGELVKGTLYLALDLIQLTAPPKTSVSEAVPAPVTAPALAAAVHEQGTSDIVSEKSTEIPIESEVPTPVPFSLNPQATEAQEAVKVNLVEDVVQKPSVPTTVPASFNLLDAGEKGVFNIGPSQGSARTTFDETSGKDVWQFDYSVPIGSIVGVWSKSYIPDLKKDTVDAVEIGIRVPKDDQLNQVSVKVEIKGMRDVQPILLRLKPGRNLVSEPINWNTIGDLKEVVFVVSPMAANPIGGSPMWFNPAKVSPIAETKPMAGTLYFDLDFGKMTFLQRNYAYIKAGLVLVTSVLVALMTFFLGWVFSRNRVRGRDDEHVSHVSSKVSTFSGLRRDFFYGVMAVLIVGMTLIVHCLGMQGCLVAGFNLNFLAIGLAGAWIVELFKSNLTGRHLTPVEVFQNILVSGLLAVASSKQELFQAPANWMQVLIFSNLIAALTFLIYHVSNVCSLVSSKRHLRAITGALIVGTPYLFNWLLLVANGSLLEILVRNMIPGLLTALPVVFESIGRLFVILIFNEVFANGIGLVTKGRILKTWKAHFFILLVSLGVVVSPEIANLGSSSAVASLPVAVRSIIAIVTTMFSFAGLWGEVYLITGISLDGGHRIAPTQETISKHVVIGIKKGMAYSGILVALIYALHMLLNAAVFQKIMTTLPIAVGILCGALIFPLLKTIIETFDGSLPFFERARYSYRNVTLYLRGAVVGFGFAYMVVHGLFQQKMSERIIFGLVIGLLASGGMSILRDAAYAFRGCGRVHSWKLYLIDSLLGAFVGSAAAFYLDSLQVPVIIEKFKLYTSSGLSPVDYITIPLLNKWGRIDLGSYAGGVKLFYIESLAGVINWSIAAWLFAINKVFMQAFFDKDKTPIKFFFSKAGFAQLVEMMIYVLRWGLWMSPIIFTFLRQMPDPTWYNRDGAIQTMFSIWNSITMPHDAFVAWSLQTFVWVVAFDFFRVLIWMDHMGLRVATLVNLSFLGLDKLDEKIARFIGPAAAQRYIPEGIKRFATWAPLLIPFYMPRGQAWDYVWNTSEAIQGANRGKGIISALQSLTLPQMLVVIGIAIFLCTVISFVIRSFHRRSLRRHIKSYELSNREYKVVLKENGEGYSEVLSKEFFDMTRRSYDMIDPCGRVLYLVEASQSRGSKARYWPVLGNFPRDKFETSHIEKTDGFLKAINTSDGIQTTVDIRLPDEDATVELWTIKLENLTNQSRELKVVPYLEWVLNGWIHDRFHTQYARLYPEMEYMSDANAILAWQKSTKSMGILATDISPEGFLTSRVDFIGRARSIWSPRIFETLDFQNAQDTAPYPTFDPIGSLVINMRVESKASVTLCLMIGYTQNKKLALDLIGKYLKPKVTKKTFPPETKKKLSLIGHGEIPPGTPQPYSEFVNHGNQLLVHTPFTPRPIDHAVSNALHSVMVTNRGLHTSCNGNSQQNRMTPDWPDTVTKEIPTEAFYLYDPDRKEWYSPTYHPLNDPNAKNESEFGVDGTAKFRMMHGTISTELTVFVPPNDPAGVYFLTVKNNDDRSRRMRIAPYFQMVLAFMPERSGPLGVHRDKRLNALFFENPRNIFRSGCAFVSTSLAAERMETNRGKFFGTDRGVARPFMVEKGKPDKTQLTDNGQIAAFLGTVEIPAHGEYTISVVMGQTNDRKEAAQLVRKYKSIEATRKSLEETRKWWMNLMGTVVVETNQPAFDRYQNWLKYQALAERIWARRGFYQTSGAYGFRDQLQDTVNLIWVDPALARKQIILHASHQFIEGDVFHWFFTLTDGRTAFSCRSHASDNPVWLAWAVVEYVKATGDDSILDEVTSYMMSEFPFAPLPKNKQGWGHLYHRTTRADSVYGHCMRSIDLVLKKRMGKHGLPLMGTGDWNDGLDEIGSEGKGESVWLGLFLYCILKDMVDIIDRKEGKGQKEYYAKRMQALHSAIEKTWRGDRYLRAFHDDGTEIGVKDSGIWEIDALTAAWAVMSGVNPERGLIVFNTALRVLEKDNAILLGWPALREGTKPYLGRSSKYPEGVRENGMYCHGVQWLVKAARILAEQFEKQGDRAKASEYRATAYRLWLKISPIPHVAGQEIENYGGQPNKQSADILTNFDKGRMIWHGYTGAAGWMLRQAMEGVVGASVIHNKLVLPADLSEPRGELKVSRVARDVGKSPLTSNKTLRQEAIELADAGPRSKTKSDISPLEEPVGAT